MSFMKPDFATPSALKKAFKSISNPKQVEDLIYKTFQKGSS